MAHKYIDNPQNSPRCNLTETVCMGRGGGCSCQMQIRLMANAFPMTDELYRSTRGRGENGRGVVRRECGRFFGLERLGNVGWFVVLLMVEEK